MDAVDIFHKVHGCGNDFIIIDIRSRPLSLEEMKQYAITLCRPHFSIGADGIVFIDNATDSQAAYRWHFYNSDGSRAEMCGNASRCVAYLAESLGIAPQEHYFQTDIGLIRAVVNAEKSEVISQLPKPCNMMCEQQITYKGVAYTYHTINTGVPHCIIFVDDVTAVDVKEFGAFLRYHENFMPAGINVDFVQVLSSYDIMIRTYERGVEDETHACGTGAVASVVIAHNLGLVSQRVDVHMVSDNILQVSLQDGIPFLKAPVEYVFRGTLL